MLDRSLITWHPSPNYHGRYGRVVEAIVIHCMEGTMSATAEWFADGASQVSAHYGVSKAGQIVQYVDENLCAWHCGRVEEPTSILVQDNAGINPNLYTIGIEHEGDGTEDLTTAQRLASISLIRDIAFRRRFPIDRVHIIGHHEIYKPKKCPDAINVDVLVQQAAQPDLT